LLLHSFERRLFIKKKNISRRFIKIYIDLKKDLKTVG